jgi:hypothetical protein
MTNIAAQNSPIPRRPSLSTFLLPPLVFLSIAAMESDFTAIAFMPLKSLGIPYPPALEYAPLIIPAACMALWLTTLYRWPRAAPIAAVLLCYLLVPMVPKYAEHKVAKIPVNRWLDSDEFNLLQARSGFPLFEQESSHGTSIFVASANEQPARQELRHQGLLDGNSSGS